MTNGEFLAKYPTDETQIDYYTELAIDTFREFKIDGSFSKKGVRTNVKIWYDNKKKQMELFRKHPHWNEEAKAIIFQREELRTVDYEKAYYVLCDIIDYICEKIDAYPHMLYTIRNTLYSMLSDKEQNSQINERFLSLYKDYKEDIYSVSQKFSSMLKVGTKITRLVRQYCEDIGATKLELFEKYYAKFSDCMSELTVQKTIVASLHFCDFMTMSNGNSWMTCHYINSHKIFHEDSLHNNSGGYKQGCLSYALDEFSLILYTLPSKYDGREYRVQKINRMCCQYKNGVLITGKCYPDNSTKSINMYRETLQEIIATAEELPNSWTCSDNIYIIKGLTTTAEAAAHYKDYAHSEQKPSISICRSSMFNFDDKILIGHQAYCLYCGEKLYNGDKGWLQCSKHRQNMICQHCGQIIENPEKSHVIKGTVYCDDCVFYCAFHKQYEPVTKEHCFINGNVVVCQESIKHLYKCECGTYLMYGDENCPKCGRSNKNHVGLVLSEEYEAGDYVLIVNDVTVCDHGCNDEMENYYSGRIVKINEDYSDNSYYVSSLDNNTWTWSKNCFAGIVKGANDSMIGMKWEDITNENT